MISLKEKKSMNKRFMYSFFLLMRQKEYEAEGKIKGEEYLQKMVAKMIRETGPFFLGSNWSEL